MQAELDSIEADQRRFRIRLALFALGLALLGVGGWFGRTAYRHVKERREQALAQSFLAKGDLRNAVLSARQTLLLNPSNVPACSVMAVIADRAHSPETTNWLERIVQTEPSLKNKLWLASAGLRYQSRPFPRSAQLLDELAAEATNRVDYQVVAANLALNLGRLPEAEAHFETATALEPTNRLFALNLAMLRLASTNEERAAAARGQLEQMRTETNFAAAALRALAVDRLAHQDTAAAGDYGAQLLARPEATLGDRLQQLGILQKLHGDGFDPLLEAVQAAAATNAPAAAQVAAWMQANGLLAGSLQWLTNLPAGMRAQNPVRIVLADGFAQVGDWRTLRDFASQGNWGDMEFLRLALLSRAWSQLDVRAAADGSWGSAVTEAGNRYETLTKLLKLAEKWKLPDKREDLLERIVTRFPRESWAQQALAESYFATGKTAELNQLYARLYARFPQNPTYENNLAATALLLKTNLAQAGQWAREVYAGNTNDAAFAATYAFALYRLGRAGDGLAVLRKVDKTLQERPDVALYYGCLLAATGATNEAAPYLEIAGSRGRLLPEEQRLLAEATGK